MKQLLKIFFCISFNLFFSLSALAVDYPPKKINLQAVLLDAGGNVMLNLQQADITFSVVDGSGTVSYQETQAVPVVSGAISVLVGDGFDPATGALTGGIPYDALDPTTGTKMLRIQLTDQSVPQEDFEMVSTPYSYYSQFAVELVEPIETGDILDGTITQADLSADLLTFLTSNTTTTTTSTSGNVNASDVIVQGTFTNIPSGNLLGALQSVDQTLTLQSQDIQSVLQGGVLNNQYLRIDGTNTMIGDLDLGGNNINNTNALNAQTINTTSLNTQSIETATLHATGDLDLDTNIIIDGTVDGVDISDLQLQANNIQSQVTSNDSDITNLQTQIDANDVDISSLQTQINNNDTDIANLQSTDTSLQTQINSNDTEIANLQTQINSNDTDISSLQTQINSNDTEISNLQTQITNNDTDISNLQSRMTSAESTISSHTSTINNHESRLTTVENNQAGGSVETTDRLGDTDTPEEGRLYKNNMIFAWGRVDACSGCASPTASGFNVQSSVVRDPAELPGSSRYKIFFRRAAETSNYLVLTSYTEGTTFQADNVAVVKVRNSNFVIIDTQDASTSGGSTIDNFFFMVVGGDL